MNIEKAHAIFLAIRDEIKSDQTVSLFQQLVTALQNQVSQPQQPNHQQQVSAHLKNLRTKLSNAKSNNFSPAWRMMIEELEISDYLGVHLLETVDEIFSRNQITPATALEELNQIFPKLQSIEAALNQILTGFSSLKIGAEELEPGSCEIGVLIPRTAIKNNIENLSKELKEISGIFGTFEEISTGERTGLELRTVSSSDPSFYFDTLPSVAAFTAVAIERIVSLYKSLLQIKKLRLDLKKEGIPAKELKGIDQHANKIIADGIEKLVPELIKEFSVVEDNGRLNELKNSLRISLNKIANRIDKGFNVEIRAEEPEDVENREDPTEIKHISLIIEKSESLRFIKSDGEPILSLPENSDEKKKS